MTRTTALKAGVLALLVIAAVALAVVYGTPDTDALRTRVDAAGVWGPVVFIALYGGLAMIPSPMSVVTIAAGALFGLWTGAVLVLAGAMLAAVGSFALGRLLGRDAVDRFTQGRLARVDAMLRDHGLAAVLVVRLVPLFPFFAVNYASGLSGVRLNHYLLGSALGMVPGVLAYTAVGAFGSDPLGLLAAISALVALIAVGGWWARRLERRHAATAGTIRPARNVRPARTTTPTVDPSPGAP